MNGILVVNHFLKSEKFDFLYTHLVNSAKKCNIHLAVKTNLQMLFCNEKVDFVLFWDKDTNLAKALEQQGYKVFNSSQSIALCDDKAKTYLALKGIVPQPKTLIAPLSYFECDYSEFADLAIKELGLPLVFKECYGSFGEQVYLCHSKNDIISHITSKPFILQQFVAGAKGCDIRIEVVDGKCVSAMARSNKGDFRSNITNGGCALPYTPTDYEQHLAITACNALGLTFGGVDILKDGESIYVCEVNSNAHIINIMNCNNIDVAPFIFDAIRSKI